MTFAAAGTMVSTGEMLAVLPFSQDGCAAGQTAVQLPISSVAAAESAIVGYTAPAAGVIVAVTQTLETAATAGTLTISPTINGTAQTKPTLTVTTAQSSRALSARNQGHVHFDADDLLGAEITTDASWDGTGDLGVTLWILLDVEPTGI